MRRALWIFAVGLAFHACGDDGSPVGPTGRNVVDVAGVWNYTATLTNISGGECVGALVQSSVGSQDQGTISFTQNGDILSATVRDLGTGASCAYSGTAGSNSIALSWNSCEVAVLVGIRCPNGALRDMRMLTNSINATITGRSGSGTQAETWNVFSSTTGAGVGIFSATSNFTASRQ
jgi:hypothetical protein